MRQNPNPHTVSRIKRDYETNDVSAAEDQIRGDVLLSICFISMPQHHNNCEY
jgi:hypothetical protein